MIVGNGDIASILPERAGLLFFASGVSNSQETREEEYQREKDLLLEQPRDWHIVYFGSLAVFYSNTRYTRHKLEMEGIVKKEFPEHTIFRIGNITWGTNPHTLINHFRDRFANNEDVEVRDEYRYVVDKDEFLHWIGMIPVWNCEMNVPGKKMKVKEIIDEYCYVGLSSKKI